MRKNSPEVSLPPTRLRCAIYTRKSTEEGLDQEFNSLDAQREAGVAVGGIAATSAFVYADQ
jgi:site-specific DNA recombinase